MRAQARVSRCSHRPLLDDEVDVPEGDVLDLGLSGQQGDQRRGELLQQGVVVVRVLGQQFQKLHQHLDRREHHGRVGVGQPGRDALADAWKEQQTASQGHEQNLNLN